LAALAARLEREPIDVCILDATTAIALPQDAIRAVRDLSPRVTLALVPDRAQRELRLRAGVDVVLDPAQSSAEMLEALGTALRRRRDYLSEQDFFAKRVLIIDAH
jgi:hypothetical protein